MKRWFKSLDMRDIIFGVAFVTIGGGTALISIPWALIIVGIMLILVLVWAEIPGGR